MPAKAVTGPARTRAIMAGALGNLVEWYDFYVYAFTALYFSASFFPAGDRTAQLLATSAIYAVGFLMRPLGGWYFGWLADAHGRRRAMTQSIAMMAMGSLAIAFLPTHATIGAAAPVLLLAARLLQGFSTGGEYGAVATYLSEVATPGRRGLLASVQYVTLIGGQLAALLVILLLQSLLTEAEMRGIGWRIAFAGGAIAALGVLLLRAQMQETVGERHPEAGRIGALLAHWRGLLIVVGLTAGGSLSFYVFSTYMQKYLVNTAGLEPRAVNWIMTAVLVPFMLLQPLFGALSDRIGRRRNMIAFGVLATLATVPLLRLLGSVQSPFAAFALVLVGLTINSFYTSVSGLFKAELFPVHVRALGVGLAYGVANGLFGGSAEAVALFLKQRGHEGAFAWYATAICGAALLTALLMRDTRDRDPLADVR